MTAVRAGDVLSYNEMCEREGMSLQRGMNFRVREDHSVLLMSQLPNAPYADQVRDGGRVLIYEGHDAPRERGSSDPKLVDQPLTNSRGSVTQNGLFFSAAERTRDDGEPPEQVRVYEKIKSGIWVFNGTFNLVDAWMEQSGPRLVCKFKLELTDELDEDTRRPARPLPNSRIIPTAVKVAVWKRDHGQCVICGNTTNLHFDHIIPYSRGGSSLVADNIQLLCAKHNLAKHDRIE